MPTLACSNEHLYRTKEPLRASKRNSITAMHPTIRSWWILLKRAPIFLFFLSPVIHLFFFSIHLFFSIMLALILKISHHTFIVSIVITVLYNTGLIVCSK